MASRVALITGASSGIGRETAIALSAAGWSLMITARREKELAETAGLCKGPKTEIFAGNVSDPGSVETLFKTTIEKLGRLDMLFNNAGTGAPSVPIEDLPVSAFINTMNVNLLGPWICTREAVRIFKSQTPAGGRIINNGSISAHTPRPHSSPYTATKHAITGLTKSTALDGRAWGIACTQIDIGNALTPLAAKFKEGKGVLQADGKTYSQEAVMDVKHVADAVVHIASLPNSVSVLEMTIMATEMPYVGRG